MLSGQFPPRHSPSGWCGLHTPGQIWPCLWWKRRLDAAPSEPGDRRGTRLGNTARARAGQEALGLRAPFPGKVLFSTRADTLTISIKGLLSIFNKKRSCLKQKYHNNYSIYFLSTTQHGLPQTVLQKCTQMVPAQELTLAMCVVASCSPKFQRPEINTQVQTHSCDNAKQLRAAPKQPP